MVSFISAKMATRPINKVKFMPLSWVWSAVRDSWKWNPEKVVAAIVSIHTATGP